MKYSIGKMISKSIKENKWLNVIYKNKDNEETTFWCSIRDIDILQKRLIVDIFNVFKGNNTLDGSIYYDKIIKASVVDGTYYTYDQALIEKIEKNINKLDWLEFDNYNDKDNMYDHFGSVDFSDGVLKSFEFEYLSREWTDQEWDLFTKDKSYHMPDSKIYEYKGGTYYKEA